MWRLTPYASHSSSRSLNGKCPSAWAPSTIVTIPLDRASRLSRCTGSSCAVPTVSCVSEMQDLRSRRDRAFEAGNEIIRCCRDRELNPNHLDTVAPSPLVPSGKHPGIILFRSQNLVPSLEIEAVLHDLAETR